MYGRVTGLMQSASLLSQLSRNNEDLFVTQQQIATGKRILTPSMDAFGSSEYLRYASRASRNSSYLDAVSDLTATYNFTDGQLNQGSSIVNSLKTIALRESNDGASDSQTRLGSITEINSLRQALMTFANATLGGQSIFAGQNTTSKAFGTFGDAVVYNGTAASNMRFIEDGLQVASTLEAGKVFGALETVSASRKSLNAAVGIATVSPPGYSGASTQLSQLNNGRGVDRGIVTVTVYPDGATSPNGALNYQVDLRNARTVADVAEAFNNVKGKNGQPVFDMTTYTGGGTTWPQTSDSLLSGLRLSASGELASAINSRPASIRFSNTDGRTTASDLGLVSGNLTYGVTSQELTGPFNQTYTFDVTANGKTQSISVTPGGAQGTTELASELNTQINAALRTMGMYDFTVAVAANGNQLTLGITDGAGTGSFSMRGLDGASLTLSDAITNGSVTTAPVFDRAAGSFSGGVFAGRDLNAALSLTTPLSALNAGLGLAATRDASGNAIAVDGIRITNGSLAADVNFADLLATSASTIGDLMNRINASGTQVQARLTASGDRIEIVSKLVGVPLKIENLNGSLGSQLGVDSKFSEMRTADLNGGAGLGLIVGADFRAVTSTGVSVDFDLGNATTVKGVVDAINGSTGNRLPGGGPAFTASAVSERGFTSGSLPNTFFGAGGLSPISFEVSLNGREVRNITLTGPFADRDALATAMESGLNTLASQLGMDGFSASVSADNASGGLNFRLQDQDGPAHIDFAGGSTSAFGLEASPNSSGIRTLNNETVRNRFILTDNTFNPSTFVLGGAQPVLQNLGEGTVINDLGISQSDAVRVQTIGAVPAGATDPTNAFSLTVDLPRGAQLTVNVAASAGRGIGVLAADIQNALRTQITAAGIEGFLVSARADDNGAIIVETTDGVGNGAITFSGADAIALGLDAAQATVGSPATVLFNAATGSFEGADHDLRGENSDNIFTAMNDLQRALESNNATTIGSTLTSFDRALERLLDARSETGSRTKRLELAQNRLERESETVADQASRVMDTDLAEAATRMTQQQTIFQAGVQVTAQILRVSVLDFI